MNFKTLTTMLISLFAFCILHFALCTFSSAGEAEDRRAYVGLDLFPGLLAADEDIAEKQGHDGKLLLLLIYADRKDMAEEMARHLEKVKTIRGILIKIEAIENINLKDYEKKRPAGIFITQQMTQDLDQLIFYARSWRIIIFSPFEGDVARGVSAGMVISDRILPYINMEAINRSDIRLKPFFLRIAVKYG